MSLITGTTEHLISRSSNPSHIRFQNHSHEYQWLYNESSIPGS